MKSLRSGFLYLLGGIFLDHRLIYFGVSVMDDEQATECRKC